MTEGFLQLVSQRMQLMRRVVMPLLFGVTAKATAISIFVLLLPACSSEDDLDRLQAATGEAWIVTSPWTLESPNWGCVHSMADQWQAQLDAAHGLVTRQGPFSHDTRTHQTFPFSGGVLIGTDSGEFGGHVRWASAGADTATLIAENLVQFLDASPSVYALTGLAHMTISEGQLWRIVRDTFGPRAEHLLDIGDTPRVAALVDSDTLLIVTLQGLTTVALRSLQASTWRFNDWYASYANSVVRTPDGRVFVGLRQGLARLVPGRGGYRADWLVPKTLADSVSRGCPVVM